MTRRLRILLPLLVILGGAIVMTVMVKAKPTVARVEREVQPPLVRVVEVTRGPVALNVHSTGTVEPARRSTLVAQIGARVARLSPGFAEGAFFDRGDLLVRLESRDFELAVTQAEARVAQAQVQFEREQAEARLAVEEWDELGLGEPTALVIREPQLARARADLESSQAALEQDLAPDVTSICDLFDPQYKGKGVTKVLVQSKVSDLGLREKAEARVVQRLKSSGIGSVRYGSVFFVGRKVSAKEFLRVKKEQGFDAWLVIVPVDAGHTKTYVPPSYHTYST
ncbi:MAG: hypothetical protein IH936_10075, partial [Acidobacteria bacterium]|nr:hypothetical protein [Acidobacteriota bacterium]